MLNYSPIYLQLLTAIILTYFSMRNCIDRPTRNALARLAIISTASAVAALLSSIDTFLAFDMKLLSAILLFALGIRMPDYDETSSKPSYVNPLFAYRLMWSEIKKRLLNKIGNKHKSLAMSLDGVTATSSKY
ncbi:hypothetical protein BDF19DRAFT_415174 [Syncephalis fuscata]|nr:hypothetical protein BDF19DRAFT_415174 [Syncephalis fuscata]